MRNSIVVVSGLLTLASFGCGHRTNEQAGEVANMDPDSNFAIAINQFAEAQAPQKPWASTFWPYTDNGVGSTRFSKPKDLSPTEKYDKAHGCRTHSHAWEVQNHGKSYPFVAGWFGHCNGWSGAAALVPEPPVEMKVNGVTFSRSDMKGLLSEAGMVMESAMHGTRVDSLHATDYSSPAYDDVVPAEYFHVLTHYMGKLHKPVVIDRFTGNEVWNQPLAAYRFEYPTPADYLGEHPNHPGVYRINVTSTLGWANDMNVDPNAETPPFSWDGYPSFDKRTLKMELWLDGPIVFDPNGKITASGDVILFNESDRVLGGVWRNEHIADRDQRHPDFMWIPHSFSDASDPVINKPEDYDGNPEIDYKWLIRHFVEGAPDDATPSVCPSPSPSSLPSTSPSPLPSAVPGTTPSPEVPRPPHPRPDPSAGPHGLRP